MRTNHSMHITVHIGEKTFLKQQSYFHACFDDSNSKKYLTIEENTNLERISSHCAYPNCAVCM